MNTTKSVLIFPEPVDLLLVPINHLRPPSVTAYQSFRLTLLRRREAQADRNSVGCSYCFRPKTGGRLLSIDRWYTYQIRSQGAIFSGINEEAEGKLLSEP